MDAGEAGYGHDGSLADKGKNAASILVSSGWQGNNAAFVNSNFGSEGEGNGRFCRALAEPDRDGSISAFARKVGLSEALIRKYLKGAEPGLGKANQIAMAANCSLEWLATGCGYLYRQAEVVDREALSAAGTLLQEQLPQQRLPAEDELVTLLAYYQFLRSHKQADGFLDLARAREFGKHLHEA